MQRAPTAVTTNNPPDGMRAGRLAAVEAMRGIAALAVVFYHFPPEFRTRLQLPPLIDQLFSYGYLGVDAFFVLSGFVIALSTQHAAWSRNYIGRFFLRRSIRLDPPYWAAIAIEPLLGWLGLRYFGDQSYHFPNVGDVIAHLFYVQDLFGRSAISAVFWTLCFEIQFYALLVGAMVVAHSKAVQKVLAPRVFLTILLIALTLWSLAVRSDIAPAVHPGLALVRIYQFALGILVFLWATGRIPATVGAIAILSVLISRVLSGAGVEASVLLVAALTCYASHQSPAFNEWTRKRPVQFLGAISYSLYLYHGSVVGRAAAIAVRLVPRFGTPVLWVGFFLGLLGSIAVAYVLHRLIEAPVMRWSKRVKLPEVAPAVPSPRAAVPLIPVSGIQSSFPS